LKNKYTLLRTLSLAVAILTLPSCKEEASTQKATAFEDTSHLLGGDTTVNETSRKAFTLSARNLEAEHKSNFFVGNSFFNKNWVQAPASAEARDGLGPLFIARSCSGCHTQDGRGRPPLEGENYNSLLFRLAVKKENIVIPHPIYGDQLQTKSLGSIKEPNMTVRYEVVTGTFQDGTKYSLQKPIYKLSGELDTLISPRVAQAVIGLGLLEAIPEDTLREWADPDDENQDGISGRINQVHNIKTGKLSIGRFGWKANQPNIRQQVASAFNGDIGITTSMKPNENHTKKQSQGLAHFQSGGSPEVSDKILDAVTLYCQTIAVPAQREYKSKSVRKGRELFNSMNCNACHKQQITTSDHPIRSLTNQTIHPYTDILLHDMGAGLADHSPDHEASGTEWRTAPLWGIGLVKTVNKHTRFLHDGRARNIEEAILWHGGEAKKSQQKYLNLTKQDRKSLLDFLNSL
jgi:CxxC motif-containing protein (DUF1111 family)